jgi:hypothetical protein
MRTKLPAATSKRTVLLHTQLVCRWRYCAMCSGTESFQRTFGHHVARSYTPWLLSVGSNDESSLERQSSHSPWTEGSFRKFNQEDTSDWIVACVCKQDKTCWCVSRGGLQHFLQLKYEQCIRIHVHELSEYPDRLRQLHGDFWLTCRWKWVARFTLLPRGRGPPYPLVIGWVGQVSEGMEWQTELEYKIWTFYRLDGVTKGIGV